jgi:hypothetical protein
MQASSNKNSQRIAWAVGISVFLHLSLAAVYVLTPWIRTLLAFSQLNKPVIKLDMGMPQFVDVMLEELKNATPETPPETPKVEDPIIPPVEPPKETPKVAVVIKKDPDRYIEPIEPKTKPVVQPASEPTSLATSQPTTEPTSLVAAKEPGTKPVKAGGIPLVATGMVDVMPATSKWLVLLGTAQMRESPRKEVLGYSMRNHVFTEGEPLNKTGLDALDDVEEVMLSTPNPWLSKNRFAFIVRLRDTQEKAKKKMEATAVKAGTKLVSAKINGHEIWQWESEAKLGATGHYVFAFLSPEVMVIGVPATMQQFFSPAATSQPSKAPVITQPTSEPVVAAPPKTLNKIMTERGQAPAVLFAVSDLGKTLPIKQISGYDWGEYVGFLRLPPQPLYFRAAFNAGDKANASFEAAFLTEKDAVAGASSINAVMPLLTTFIAKQKPFDLLVPIAKQLKFKVYGKTIRADIEISPEDVSTLLQGFEPIIKGEAPPEEDPLKLPTPTSAPLTPAQPASLPLDPPL